MSQSFPWICSFLPTFPRGPPVGPHHPPPASAFCPKKALIHGIRHSARLAFSRESPTFSFPLCIWWPPSNLASFLLLFPLDAFPNFRFMGLSKALQSHLLKPIFPSVEIKSVVSPGMKWWQVYWHDPIRSLDVLLCAWACVRKLVPKGEWVYMSMIRDVCMRACLYVCGF